MAVDFTEKLGPLPVWGWGVIGGGVVIVGAYLLNRGGNDGGDASDVAILDPSGYQTSGINGGSASIDETPTFDNNVLWLTRASRQVAQQLSKSPTDVYAAIKKWLYGQDLTVEEKGWVDAAVGQVGSPPEGTQGISPIIPDKVTPTPTPTPNPVAVRPKLFIVYLSGGRHYWVLVDAKGNQSRINTQATANNAARQWGSATAASVATINALSAQRKAAK